MMKTSLLKVNRLLILFIAVILLCTPVSSNQAQVEIFTAGINLGLAKARLNLYGQETLERFILRDLGLAKEMMSRGENLLSPFTSKCETRKNQMARVIRKIDDYSRLTRNRSANERMIYIKNIFEMYRSALAITLDTSRGDSCRAQSNCDGQLVLAGYKFGEAWVSTEIQENRARSFQNGRLSEMRDAIRKGIWLSMDIPNQKYTQTGIRKLCCSFGDRDEWYRFMNSLNRNTANQIFRNLLTGIQGTIRRGNLNGTPCMGDENRREDNRREDHEREENLERGHIIPNMVYALMPHIGQYSHIRFRSNGSLSLTGIDGSIIKVDNNGGWSFSNQSSAVSFWGPTILRFSGTVYKDGNKIKLIGKWSDGSRGILTLNPGKINPY